MALITREVLERLSRELIDYAIHKLGAGVGVTIFVFEFGQDKNLAYVSNATRETMIETLKEFLAKQEVGLYTDPPGPRARG